MLILINLRSSITELKVFIFVVKAKFRGIKSQLIIFTKVKAGIFPGQFKQPDRIHINVDYFIIFSFDNFPAGIDHQISETNQILQTCKK